MLQMGHTQAGKDIKIHIGGVKGAVQLDAGVKKTAEKKMTGAHFDRHPSHGIDKGTALIRVKVDENVKLPVCDFLSHGPKRPKMIVPPFFVDGPHMVDIRIMENHIL